MSNTHDTSTWQCLNCRSTKTPTEVCADCGAVAFDITHLDATLPRGAKLVISTRAGYMGGATIFLKGENVGSIAQRSGTAGRWSAHVFHREIGVSSDDMTEVVKSIAVALGCPQAAAA